jgi:hypothetical protein
LTEKHHNQKFLNARRKAEQKRFKGILLEHEKLQNGHDRDTSGGLLVYYYKLS